MMTMTTAMGMTMAMMSPDHQQGHKSSWKITQSMCEGDEILEERMGI